MYIITEVDDNLIGIPELENYIKWINDEEKKFTSVNMERIFYLEMLRHSRQGAMIRLCELKGKK